MATASTLFCFGLGYTARALAADLREKGWIIRGTTRDQLAQAYASLGRRQDEMKVRLASVDVVQRYLEMNPHDSRALIIGANQLYVVGEQEKGLEMAERALGQDENNPNLLYNAGCFYARQGDIDRSLELLARAVELGWGNRDWLETDSDLDSLRADHRFVALLKGMQ